MAKKKQVVKRTFSKEESREFRERSQIQEKDLEIVKTKHNLRMEQITFERETNRLFHEWALERGRINRAEDRKLFYEKQHARKGYY